MLMPGQIARPQGGRPRKGNRFAVELLEIMPGASITCVVLSELVEWYFLHWFNGQHVPHLAPPSPCVPCSLNMPYRSHGYLCVQVEGQQSKKLLHLTERMYEEEPALHPSSGVRGLQLRVSKPGKHKTCRTTIRHEGHFFEPEKLPQPVVVDLMVRQMFSGAVENGGVPKTGEVWP